MPVEINELVIRTLIEPRATGVSQPQRSDEPSPQPPIDPVEIVQECVREVMRILDARRER